MVIEYFVTIIHAYLIVNSFMEIIPSKADNIGWTELYPETITINVKPKIEPPHFFASTVFNFLYYGPIKTLNKSNDKYMISFKFFVMKDNIVI